MLEIPLEQIIVGERFRQEYNNIPELAASLQRYGQLQPLVVDKNLRLIAGGRRLRALTYANIPTAKVIYRDEVDELTARELELEENIQREDLTWIEKAKLVAEVDRLKRLKYGDAAGAERNAVAGEAWGSYETAEALDLNQSSVSRDLLAARIVEAMPELADAPDRKTALTQFERLYEKIERELAVRQGKLSDSNVHLGDCRDVLTTLPEASVDLILLDPPYGTDTDRLNQGVAHADTHFDDSVESALQLMRDILPELARVLKPNGHIYCFAGLKTVHEIRQPLYAVFANLFEVHGFAPDYIPLAWVKTTAGLVEFEYRFAPAWEPILFVSYKEMRPLASRQTNVFQIASVYGGDKMNQAQKPDELYKQLIEISTREGEVVLDPTAGSGRSLVVAKQLKRKYIGIEQDRDQYNEIIRSLAKEDDTDEKKASTDVAEAASGADFS